MLRRPTGAAAPADAEQGVRRAVGLLVVGALVLGAREGGFAPSAWGPFAVLVLWGTLACAWSLRRVRPARPLRIALVTYGLLCLWTLLSVTWADTPGRALDATGRTVLYGLALAVAVLPRWPRPSVRRLLGLFGFGTALLALGTLLWVDRAALPSRFFIDGRLIAPTGYVNATAGLWGMALFPLVHLAAGGARTARVRVLALAAAALVLQVSLLSQSRGAILAAIVAAIVLVALTPHRGPVLLVLAAVLLATLPAAGTLLDVRGAPTVAVLADRLDTATERILVAVVVLAVLGALWQSILVRLPWQWYRPLVRPRLGNAAAVGLVVLVALVAVAKTGNPVSYAYDRVDEALFAGYDGVAATGDRLTGSLGSNRGEMYRVAIDIFEDHPLRGNGAEDFQARYLQQRTSGESPKYAHSLELGVLSGLGLVGLALLLTALAAPVVAALRGMRELEPETRAGVAATLAAFVAWFAGASWDWTWEFPALSVVAFVLLGVAGRATEVDGTAPTPELQAIRARARAHGVDVPDAGNAAPLVPRTRRGRTLAVGVLVATVLATVVFAALGASSYLLRRGSAQAGTDRAAAAADLRLASELNPLDSDALLSRAIVVRRDGDEAGWRTDLEEVLRRSPQDWLAHLELGMADARLGRRAAAIETLQEAVRLNPRQPLIGDVLRLVRRGAAVDPDEVEVALSDGLRARLKPTQP